MTFWAVLIPAWIGVNVALPPTLEVARERRHLDCRDLWCWRRRWQTTSLSVWATVAVGYWPGGAWGFPLVAAVSVAQIVSLATQRRPLVVWNLKMEFARAGLPLTVVWGNLATVLAGYEAHRSHDDERRADSDPRPDEAAAAPLPRAARPVLAVVNSPVTSHRARGGSATTTGSSAWRSPTRSRSARSS